MSSEIETPFCQRGGLEEPAQIPPRRLVKVDIMTMLPMTPRSLCFRLASSPAAGSHIYVRICVRLALFGTQFCIVLLATYTASGHQLQPL